MAKEPEDLTLRLVRQVRETQLEHGDQLKELRKRLDDLYETATYTVGMAFNAHRKVDTIENRLEELAKRVEKLEEAD